MGYWLMLLPYGRCWTTISLILLVVVLLLFDDVYVVDVMSTYCNMRTCYSADVIASVCSMRVE